MAENIFDKAMQQAANYAYDDLAKQGYKEKIHNIGSHFHTLSQRGKDKLALLFSVFVEPNIITEYEIRGRDIRELSELIQDGYKVFCYHYNFDPELEKNQPIVRRVNSPSEIVVFLEENGVIVQTPQ